MLASVWASVGAHRISLRVFWPFVCCGERSLSSPCCTYLPGLRLYGLLLLTHLPHFPVSWILRLRCSWYRGTVRWGQVIPLNDVHLPVLEGVGSLSYSIGRVYVTCGRLLECSEPMRGPLVLEVCTGETTCRVVASEPCCHWWRFGASVKKKGAHGVLSSRCSVGPQPNYLAVKKNKLATELIMLCRTSLSFVQIERELGVKEL